MTRLPKNILVVYRNRGSYPLRPWIHDHLHCFRRYSTENIFHLNAPFWIPSYVRKIRWDLVLFHTTFLAARWHPPAFLRSLEKFSFLKNLTCPKVVLPQDEYMHSRLLSQMIRDFGITHVLTCAEKADIPKIYASVDFSQVHFKTVLPGYMETEILSTMDSLRREIRNRSVDVGYRATPGVFWFGRHGLQKQKICDVFRQRLQKSAFQFDLSTSPEQVQLGKDWFRFLLRCRFTLGMESGSSLLDPEGKIKSQIQDWLQRTSSPSFEEAEKLFFPGEDGKIRVFTISPRHFEACAAKTCQILLEGDYNGILKPWEHYLPLKQDYSNLEEIFGFLGNEEKRNAIAEKAYSEVALQPRNTYAHFVEETLEWIFKDRVSSTETLAPEILRDRTFHEKSAGLCVLALSLLKALAFLLFPRTLMSRLRGLKRK